MFRPREQLGPSARRGARRPGVELDGLGLPGCGGGYSSPSSRLFVAGTPTAMKDEAANCCRSWFFAAIVPPGLDLVTERGRELEIEMATGRCSVPLLLAPPQLAHALPTA
ncbi:hypothetical protein SETIT_6G139700v2 [Setaria italica]|uniref:Uncharacterized protein n=1 Tax=Setaria italica TaxID=4555 RepID=A0A368RN05_SETIT|nr:hypothetical protein SETIT_6G139700v2 [Setaria italica]